MALTKRIIPCLDVKDGRTVKGVNFENIRDVGDPVALGQYYAEQGADELVFLDITATNEKRKTLIEMVKNIAASINIPFTVGGGISTIEDVTTLLEAGADKISVNTAAVKDPNLISKLADRFGSQCIVLAIDAKQADGSWYVHLNGGRIPTEISAGEWAKRGADLGAGEILLTSINNDGTKQGFACQLIQDITGSVNIPLIASGGAGKMIHFVEAFNNGADAALAAGIFHNKEVEIPALKKYLRTNRINVRI